MTKLGNNPNFISRVEPGSAAALSGLCVDDYLIELNEKNIEDLDNSLLKQAIFQQLEPENGGEFSFTTINKAGYEYCVQNGIKPGNFIQINRQLVQAYETPREMSAYYTVSQPLQQTQTMPQPIPQPVPQPPPQPPPIISTSSTMMTQSNYIRLTYKLTRNYF